MLLILLFSLLSFVPLSQSAIVVVDGVSQWKNPQVLIGDSVIFQHKYNYSLYIFKNQDAFTLCNFNQATILTKPSSSSYTWRTSRPGFFYFSFNNGTNKACLDGQKLAVNVLVTPPQNRATAPEMSPPAAAPLPSTGGGSVASSPAAAPPPSTGGGSVASSPAFPWPSQPVEDLMPPSQAPGSANTASSPTVPDKEGIPFINSNPAVPLPTGEIDTATIRPLPTSGHQESKQVVGFPAAKVSLGFSIIGLLMMMV